MIPESFAIVALLTGPSPVGRAAPPVGGDAVVSVVYPKALHDGWLEVTPLFGASTSTFVPLAEGTARATISVPRNVGAFVLCVGGEGIAAACEWSMACGRSPSGQGRP